MKIYKDYDDLPKIKLPLGQEVSISDSTIRDGAQMPGIVMKSQQKLQIYEYLHRIGIEKLESFVYNERDRKAIKLMMDHGYEFPEVTGWARANPADIDMVLNIDGIEETGILMSVSDPHIVDKMGLTREAAEEKYLNALQYAVDHGLRTRAHIEDMTRADNYDFTFPLIKKIMDIDPDCTIRICDTIGFGIPFTDVDEPFGMPMITKYLKDELNVKNIETHCHDDFGLAVANSIAGYWHGANWSNVTFLGIGERAGNAEMEKLLLFLARRIEGFDKYNLDCLVEFSRFMEREIGIRIPRNKSVVGNNVFAHESGIHSAGVIKNPFTYEPYPPEIVGGKRIFLIGDSSGIEVLRYKVQETLNELMDVNIEIDKNDKRLRAIQAEIQKLYNDEKRVSCISDEEVMGYVKKYFMFNPMLSKDMNRKEEEENGNLDEGKKSDEIKPRMHDTID
ncbi:isopropylmalate synthase [Methanolobus vulcani]|jgi:isopropylmalate/homocitrate/citramalate synthase|uniref:Isopropylmalate synthase n=1 Tax=Methanolobus vulcani TaxID=38026 RepID=A0A7Z8KN93_9EURY|nr:isopropylmalate synthase [Methanolobus vulcani]TQD25285.1 isopropylmalate synthase [Methanolobus vulcani]